MLILGVETSCDDTCAAVTDGARIRSNVISSQAAAHARYGGVVPEVASRHHLELVNPVVDAALSEAGVELADLDALAVTRGPGLIGALLVGVTTAKALAAATRKPLIGVDHLHGHVAANFLEPEPLEPPFLCLIASGGHTLLAGVAGRDGFEVLGQTLDDAAGEALDKGARLLGLGYPGGPGDRARWRPTAIPDAFDFPVAMTRDPGPGLQLQRPEDGAAVRGPGAGRRARSSGAAPTSPPATRRRSSASWSPSSSGPCGRASGRRWRSAAGWPPTRCSGAGRRALSRSAGCA